MNPDLAGPGEMGPDAEDVAPEAPVPLDAVAETLVERAIESVLDQVPDVVDDPTALDRSPKYQPWADTAAPNSKNKRPLEELLAVYAQRVAEAPDAVAGSPGGKHPAVAFFDRFGSARRGDQAAAGGGRRRRSGRRGRSGQGTEVMAAGPQAMPGQASGERRRGRGRGRSGGGAAWSGESGAAGAAPRGEGGAAPSTGSRRRRGRRRGRGGGGNGGAPPAGG